MEEASTEEVQGNDSKGDAQHKMISDNIEEEKAVAIAVLSAIIVLAGLLAYMSLTPATQVSFVSLHLLDSEKMGENYPQSLVLGENNTFLLWVCVENFMGRIEHSSILVKITNRTGVVHPSPLDPIYRFERVLPDKETWEFPITITLNQTGEHRLIFELWLFNELDNVFSYSNRYCSIWLDVIES